MKISILLLAILVTASSLAVLADDPPAPTEVQIRSWINNMANARLEREFSSPFDRLTKDERKSLEPVRMAYSQLSKHFIASLPYLVENLGDRRVSYPSEHPSNGMFENQSVGAACRSIINSKLLLRSPMLADHRDIAVWYHLPINDKWYSRVKTMTLFEMQVDSLDWLLKQSPLRGVSKDRWAEELEEVRRFRDEFVAKGTAVDEILSPPIEGR